MGQSGSSGRPSGLFGGATGGNIGGAVGSEILMMIGILISFVIPPTVKTVRTDTGTIRFPLASILIIPTSGVKKTGTVI
jgi:hypothetical protein